MILSTLIGFMNKKFLYMRVWEWLVAFGIVIVVVSTGVWLIVQNVNYNTGNKTNGPTILGLTQLRVELGLEPEDKLEQRHE